MSALPDTRRTIGNLVSLGTIDSVDLAGATCRVRAGEIVTGDIEWLAPRAGATRIWSPPGVGEQCLLICPEGDIEAGIALPGIFSDANPAPSAEAFDLIRFADGATVSYDATAHKLTATLPEGGTAEIAAPGGIRLTGPVAIEGTLSVSQDADFAAKIHAASDITGAADVKAGGISLKTHIHAGVASGTKTTAGPQ